MSLLAQLLDRGAGALWEKRTETRRICPIDATGSIWRYVRWLTVKHVRRKRRKDFLKLHFIVDCRSLLILSFKAAPPFRRTPSRWRSS
jgi:hypothetical protein